MTTTVRITHEGKASLERIQTEWQRRTGTRPTLMRILDALTAHGEHAPEHIITQDWQPLTAAEITALDDRVQALQGWTGGSDDIDAVVYDEP